MEKNKIQIREQVQMRKYRGRKEERRDSDELDEAGRTL